MLWGPVSQFLGSAVFSHAGTRGQVHLPSRGGRGGGVRGEWVEQVSVLLPTHLGLVLRISLQTWASAWPLEAGLHFLAQGPHRLSRVTQKRALCGCPQVLRCTRTDAWAGRIGVRQSHLVVRRAPGRAF